MYVFNTVFYKREEVTVKKLLENLYKYENYEFLCQRLEALLAKKKITDSLLLSITEKINVIRIRSFFSPKLFNDSDYN